MKDLDVFHQVTLLAILKKEPGESLSYIKDSLVETGMFDAVQADGVLEDLRREGYVSGEGLTLIGVEAAKAAEVMFAKAGEEMRLEDR